MEVVKMTPWSPPEKGDRTRGIPTIDERAVAEDSGAPAAAISSSAGGTPAHRGSTLFRRHLVDSLDGGTVERVATTVWKPQYLLATTAGLGRKRRAAGVVAGIASPTR